MIDTILKSIQGASGRTESWEEMQSIKDGCGFEDSDAVEAYPKKSDIVNIANMRHLWIVPKEYASFFWRSQMGSGHKTGDLAEQLLNAV